MTTLDLFDASDAPAIESIGKRAVVLRGWALPRTDALLSAVNTIEQRAPFRHMTTPGGYTMSVALTNCGALGWCSDRRGYRYSRVDPESGGPWPLMPEAFFALARDAAAQAGFDDFTPDACLINRYVPGSRLSLHQDRNERDFNAPVVSVSLGMTATFLFGGHERAAPALKTRLVHGDVVVWGAEDRLRYHGVLPLRGPAHPLLGEQRINFTLRRAG